MKILFLVNGSAEGADGLRGKALGDRLSPDWTVRLAFRKNKAKSILSFIRAIASFQPDIIINVKMAYTGVLAGSVGKLCFGSSLICDTGDVAYALAKSTARYSRVGLGAVWLTEKVGSHYADQIITRGSYHKEVLAQEQLTNVTVIQDGVDTTTEFPHPGDVIREELALEGQFVLGCVGTMEWSEAHQFCYGWDLIEALTHLSDLPVSVLLVGDGNGRKRLETRAQELGVATRVRFVGQQPYERLAQFLGAMNACVSTQSADIVGMVRTTGKLPLYLAHDKLVLATDVGEAQRVLPGVGVLLPYSGVKDLEHPARLAQAVRQCLSEPDWGNPAGVARNVAIQHFDYGVLSKRFEALLVELTCR